MSSAQAVAFQREKDGSSPEEWEDGAGLDPGDPGSGRRPRYVVLDGATEAFDSIRWVGQLVESFLGLDGGERPVLDQPGMSGWFARMQQVWLDRTPATFGSFFEERKFTEQGSFATVLGCELQLDGDGPTWTAVALGDAVLFHLRDGGLLEVFPPMSADDFGIDPDGISTQPSQLPRMAARLRFSTGSLADGDVLLLCTDALAAWALRSAGTGAGPWATLAALDHPAAFDDLVRTELATRRLKNDDVTMVRVQLSTDPANALLVCRS